MLRAEPRPDYAGRALETRGLQSEAVPLEPLQDVLLVPLEAPPVEVAEDGGDLESFLRLLGQQSSGEATQADFYDSSPLSQLMGLQLQLQPDVQQTAALREAPPDDGIVVLRIGRGLKSVQDDSRSLPLEVRARHCHPLTNFLLIAMKKIVHL